MPHSSSDALIDVRRVCRHGIQLKLGLEWWDRQPGVEPLDPRIRSRYRRVQAASPPPTRDGAPWQEGIRLGRADRDGGPLEPADLTDPWKRQGTFCLPGIPSLDPPPPAALVLNRFVTCVEPAEVEQAPGGGVAFEFAPWMLDRWGFLSVPYPQPRLRAEGVTPVTARYVGDLVLSWTRQLQPGAWVALSLDRFWPPERDSADYIARVEDCTLHPVRPAHDPAA